MNRTHAPTNADEPDDRVSRLQRVLKASTYDAFNDAFLAEAERIECKIRAKELELERLPRHVPTPVSGDFAGLRMERDKMLRYHADRLDMIYLTLRDVYNKDAGAKAQVGVEGAQVGV